MSRFVQSDGASKGHPRIAVGTTRRKEDGVGRGSPVLNEAMAIQRGRKLIATQPVYIGAVSLPTMAPLFNGGAADGPLAVGAGVVFYTPVAGVSLRFTTDGSDPVDTSAALTKDIYSNNALYATVPAVPCTLKVRGFRSQYSPSAIVTRAYTPATVGVDWHRGLLRVGVAPIKFLTLGDGTVLSFSLASSGNRSNKSANYGEGLTAKALAGEASDACIVGGKLYAVCPPYINVVSTLTYAGVPAGYGAGANVGAGLQYIAYGNGVFVAVGGSQAAATSANGTTWVYTSANASLAGNGTITALFFSSIANLFVCSTENGKILSSSDGVTWAVRRTLTSMYPVAFAEGGGQIVAGVCSSGGTPIQQVSTDGLTWTAAPTNLIGANSVAQGGVVHDGAAFLFLCSSQLRRSVDMLTASIVLNPTPFTTAVNYGALGRSSDGRLYASHDSSGYWISAP